MMPRVTRASAARLNPDTDSQLSPTTDGPDSPTSRTTTTTSSRKRKATSDPSPSESQRDSRKKVRSKAGERESENIETPPQVPKKDKRRAAAAMSSAGLSSNNSDDTSPQQTSRDSSRRKSSRRKSKEDPSGSASASGSRRSRKGSRKDQDVLMKDADEKEEQIEEKPSNQQSGRQDGETDADDEQARRYTEEEQYAADRNDDPFASTYFGRLGGGGASLSSSLRALSGLMSGTNSRLRSLLEQLKVKDDPSVQLIALQELSELLLVSNEENLAGHFSPDQFVKELVALMQPNEVTGEENPEVMLLACRCIANMMEALPQSTASVVYGRAVPILCQKLLEIHFIDLAEQALTTLEKISVDFPSSIVKEGGLTACLTYLDFFATSTQRTAVTTAANCCRNIPEPCFPTVRDVMPILLTTLSSSDQRVVEQASLCVSRVIDSFKYHESKLEELVSPELLRAILRLLLPGSTNMIGPNIHTQFLRSLSITARASPRLSTELLKMDVVDTLYQILTGVSPPTATEDAASQIDKNIIMQAIIRTPREQIFETLNVICELLPCVSREDLSFLDDLFDAGYSPVERVSMSTRSKKTPNDKRRELFEACPKKVRRFTIILFPTLMHAYTSTVNLGVRQKVLTAQLKMLSNVDTEILVDSLRGVSYASHLASILTQQENASLITYALQAAELLLKRLEDIYRPQFYREGVMAEIGKLAERTVQTETSAGEAAKSAEQLEAQPDPEPEILEQHDEEMPEDEAEAIEMDVEHQEDHDDEQEEHDEDDEDDEENEEEREHEDDDEDHDEDRDEDHDEGEDDDGEDRSDGFDSPSAERGHQLRNMQDVITKRARQFMKSHGESGNEDLRDKASNVLKELESLGTELKACYSDRKGKDGIQLFQKLATHFDGDALESITSYELMSSGIVEFLLQIFNEEKQDMATKARSDFLEVFMATVNNSSLATGDAKSPSTAFSVLIHKLQDLLSRSEHFEVITVQHNAFESNRSSPASMLAKQLRLKLVADDDSGIPRPYRTIMVSIHAIATFKSLDDYLRPRISMIERSGGRSRESVTGAMAAYAAAMAGRKDRADAAAAQPAGASSLPTRSASKKAHRSKSSKSESAAETKAGKDEENPAGPRRSSRRRSAHAAASAPTHTEEEPPVEPSHSAERLQEPPECADEAQNMSEGEDDEDMEADLDAIVDDLEEGAALEREEPDPSAVNLEVAKSGRVTARTEDGTRVSTPSGNTPTATPTTRDRMSAHARLSAAREALASPTSSSRQMSYASALQQTPQDWHIEFSVDGQPISSDITIYRACHFNNSQGELSTGRSVWSSTHTVKFKRVSGPPPVEKNTTAATIEQATEKGSLPPSLDKHPVTSNILRLMSILHDLNGNLEDVMAESKALATLRAEPASQFVNTKLTAKLNRQLEEPLIVASQCLPGWSEDLARHYAFLFPFETRHLFLQSTSFGYSRLMARWQGSAENDNSSRRHRDERMFLGRTQRQKVRISRARILESAVKVMELYGQSSSILEVEYFEEVGTGLGPTLEFYSTVSKEFSRKKTKMWRENESADKGEYAFGRRGLFPAPMSEETAKMENGQRVLHLFRMMGKFVARSMLDSRIIDVSFNPTFFRVGEGKSTVIPSLGAVAAVDQDLAKSLKILRKYVNAKQRIDEDDSLSPSQKTAKIEEIRINDARVDDLGLDFTLPGYPHIELQSNGQFINVTIDNVDQYIKKVIDFTLSTGVERQLEAFRTGFSEVFPYSALRAFTPDELVMLFGRVEEDWSLETLMDSIKADHGYNLDSKSVRNLLHVMSELTPQARRDFLQFVTGSPRLPIGGFKALSPLFTIVCRPSEAPLTPDDCLPTVMTCANYLKLPDYSSVEMLKARLAVAIKEGQGAFHLS